MFKFFSKYNFSFNYDLGSKTWFGTGGKCLLFITSDSEKVIRIILKYFKKIFPVFIIGAGSNLIVRDGGINGIVLKLGKAFSQIRLYEKKSILQIGGSAKDYQISKFCLENNITGFEFLSGVPGTLGGNLKMNAGCYGQEICDYFLECEIINSRGEKVTKNKDEISFGYRSSSLGDDIIISAKFKVNYEKKKKINDKINTIIKDRKKSQPVGVRTGGSTFSNPKNHSAWKLIDAIKYRGKTYGGAKVSEHHSNFFINSNSATSLDLELLGEDIRTKVWDKYKIKLEWEIVRIGKYKKI